MGDLVMDVKTTIKVEPGTNGEGKILISFDVKFVDGVVIKMSPAYEYCAVPYGDGFAVVCRKPEDIGKWPDFPYGQPTE